MSSVELSRDSINMLIEKKEQILDCNEKDNNTIIKHVWVLIIFMPDSQVPCVIE